MTITKISYLNIREALDKIFDKSADGNADSFTISCPMDYDTREVTWGVNLTSRGTQTTKAMDETIKRLIFANSICEVLNLLNIDVEWKDNDIIHTMVEAGRRDEAIALNEAQIDNLVDVLNHWGTVNEVEYAIRRMEETVRGI